MGEGDKYMCVGQMDILQYMCRENTIQPEIFTRRKIHHFIVGENFIRECFSCVNDYTENEATITTLAKIVCHNNVVYIYSSQK